jgi:hypothetical protein
MFFTHFHRSLTLRQWLHHSIAVAKRIGFDNTRSCVQGGNIIPSYLHPPHRVSTRGHVFHRFPSFAHSATGPPMAASLDCSGQAHRFGPHSQLLSKRQVYFIIFTSLASCCYSWTCIKAISVVCHSNSRPQRSLKVLNLAAVHLNAL